MKNFYKNQGNAINKVVVKDAENNTINTNSSKNQLTLIPSVIDLTPRDKVPSIIHNADLNMQF